MLLLMSVFLFLLVTNNNSIENAKVNDIICLKKE